MWQNKRSLQKELLDLGHSYYTDREYHHCLRLLGRINRFLGGFRATKKAFFSLPKKPTSILEVGCGGGYLCQRLHQWFPKATITGIELSKPALKHAKAKNSSKQICFALQQEKTLDYPDQHFDVVTTMLVCHHMSDEELIEFLKESFRVSSQAVIINDLQRHYLAYLGFSLIAPFLFPNRLIWWDGRLSIRRSFRKIDWEYVLKKAGFQKTDYLLQWNFAFRWTLTLIKS